MSDGETSGKCGKFAADNTNPKQQLVKLFKPEETGCDTSYVPYDINIQQTVDRHDCDI